MRDFLEEQPWFAPVAILILLAIAALLFPANDVPELEAYTVGPITFASWTEIAGARAYQIQFRQLHGEWQTAGLFWDRTSATWPAPVGVIDYRIRAWFQYGPSDWSPATPLLFFLPEPMIPEPEEQTACG